MADDGKPTATVLRIKLRHADVETFVERFANQVTRAGVFIPTRSPKPIGTEVRFEIRLADDRPVLVGQGAVRLVREHDARKPRVVAGMAVELQRVGRDSRDVLLRMLEVRKRRGYVDGPGGMPLPGDEPEDTTATETTAIRPVPTAPAAAAAAPAAPAPIAAEHAAPAPAPAAITAEPSAPAPIAAEPSAPAPAPIAADASEGVVSAPIAAAPSAPAALAPVSRRHRVPLDLAAIASAPPTNDVLDDDLLSWAEAQVPLADVVERARALAGADLDGELAAIAAAPLPVIDRDSARAAAGLTADRPRRARLAPLPGVDSAPVASAPAPIVDGPAVVATAFDAETIIQPPPRAIPSDEAVTPVPAPLPTAPPAPPVFEEVATATDHERAAMEEAERHNARQRAAERAARERARREANDRALAERSARVRRETAERDRARHERAASVAPPVAPAELDPLAGLELDLDDPGPAPARPAARRPPDETTRKVDVSTLGGATRKVDAAALAAEALDAGALRASLTDAGDPDLGFLDALSLDDTGRRPKLPPSRAAHTVPRAPAPRPAAVIPPPSARPAPAPAARTPAAPRAAAARPVAVIPAAQPAAPGRPLPGVGPATGRKPPGPTRPVPVPSEAVDVDLDDDDEVEISIVTDDS